MDVRQYGNHLHSRGFGDIMAKIWLRYIIRILLDMKKDLIYNRWIQMAHLVKFVVLEGI